MHYSSPQARRAGHHEKFLREWLASLPPAGIRETPKGLAGRMTEFSRQRSYLHVAVKTTASLLGRYSRLIADLGWTVTTGRTGRGRYVELTRATA